VTATPPKPSLVKSSALAQAQAVTNRLNTLLPTVPSAFSPTTVYQPGANGVGDQLNVPLSAFPAGTGYYGVWRSPDLNSGRPYTVQVECFGGGGGGGGGSNTSGGGGGGGGEYAVEGAYTVKPNTNYAWVAGVPGTGGTANSGNNQAATAGGTGGTTVFDIAGTSIAGGVIAHGGAGGDTGNTGTAGTGGTGSVNSEVFTGGPGGANLPGTGGGSGGQGGTDNPVALNNAGLLSVPPNAWYVFDDASSNGQVNDNSGNSLAATASGIGGSSLAFAQSGAPSQVPGATAGGSPPSAPNPTVAGAQVQFPLNSLTQAPGYVITPGSYIRGATLTLSCWLTPDPSATWGNTVTGARAVVAANTSAYAAGTNAAGIALYFSNSGTPAHPSWSLNWYCGSGSASSTISHAVTPVAATAVYAVAVFNAGAMTLYVNGVSVATGSAGFTTFPAGPGVTCGISPGLTSDWYFGYLSNLWLAQGVLSSSGVSRAFHGTGASSTSGGAGGGASGGPAAAGGTGAGGSGTSGGAGGTPATQPTGDIGLTTPASAGVAGANSGATNSGSTPAPGAGGGGAGASSAPPAVITVQVPFITAATYCGTDAGVGAAQTVFNPVLAGTTGCLFTGGQPNDVASGSKNSLLVIQPGLAATLKNGSYTVTRVTLTVTNANPQAIQETLLEVGWAPDTSLPATYGAGDLAGSAGVIEIPAGAATVTADLTLSQLGFYLQKGTATALVLGPGASPSFDAFNADTGADFYNVIYGPGSYDKAGNSLAPYLTVTYAQTTSVQQGANGGSGAIRVTYVNQAQTLLGSWNNTQGIHAQGGQLTETSVVLGSATQDALALDRASLEPALEPTLLVPRGIRLGRRLGAIPGAPGAIFGYAQGITTVTQATPGTYMFTVPSGVTSLSVACWAGGGGGSGSVPPPPGGGGGGGGGYAANPSYAVSPGQVITYVVGGGGAGGAPNFIGSDGTNSVFDFTNVAGNGVTALAGLQWLPQFNSGLGGGIYPPLGPGVGTVLFAGGNGASEPGPGNGAGGGGSAGASGAGGGGNVGGTGGAAGAGGGGAGGNGGGVSGNGSNGSAPGGGGGGGGYNTTSGGNGGNGKVVIAYVNATTLAHTLATAPGTDALGNSYAAGLTTTQATMGAGTVSGVLTATGGTVTGPSVVVTDTWQTASLINSWSASGGGVNGIRYRLLPSQLIEIEGDIINVTATGNSICMTLPAAYAPAGARNNVAFWNNVTSSNSASPPWIFTDVSGNVQVTGISVANKGIFFHIFVPVT
jgi:Concanavalin A-like lectin/glucanases superfamily